MKVSLILLSCVAITLALTDNLVFKGSDGQSIMYTISETTMSWIDAAKVSNNNQKYNLLKFLIGIYHLSKLFLSSKSN